VNSGQLTAAKRLLAIPELRRLIGVRLLGQFGDGVFQAALAGAVLFNPERQAHAADIAAGFVVLLLPYSLLGPFAGVLLDRWWRRNVLTGANAVRAAMVCGVALEIAAGVHGQPFYLSALLVISVNRFILSALSASLPHVIDPPRLITASALSTTSGAVIASLGGGLAVLLRSLSGSHNLGSAIVATGAGAAYLGAALVARGFAVSYLGPDADTRQHGESVRHVLGGLVAGARHVRSHRSVVQAFLVIAVHRFGYGITAITTLLLYRNYFTDDGFFRAGLPGLAQVVAGIAVGGGLAAVATPWAARHLGYTRWPALLLVTGGIVQWTLGLPFRLALFLPAAALLGFVAQGIKICVDTLVAQRVADDFRGRVFSLYDTLFNLVFVAAAVLTALVLPENGRSTVAVLTIGVLYVVAGVGYVLARDPEAGDPDAGPPEAHGPAEPAGARRGPMTGWRTSAGVPRPPRRDSTVRAPSAVRADTGTRGRPEVPEGYPAPP
jgi:MFS family permease